jgi:uncharacterized protein YegL
MMCCSIGSRGALLSSYSKKEIPSSTTLTYEGLFSENFFKINQKEKNLLNNLEISSANIINPLNNEKETWIGLLTKSKYDGIGIREPIDICLLIDISGSMGMNIKNSSNNRLDITKNAVLNFMKNINDKDNVSVIKFNSNADVIIPFTNGKIFKEKFDNFSENIKSLKDCGGTNLYIALLKAYDIMKTNSVNKYKRIIFITDMEYYEDREFKDLCLKSSEENIFITFLGISEQFNTELVEQVAKMRGCNYYVIKNEEDIQKYLIDDFNYTCFVSDINTRIELLSPNLKIEKVIGTGIKESKEKNILGKDEWFPSKHKDYENEKFRNNVKFLMLYFNRKNKILPKPILSNFCNFLKCERKIICEIKSTFPSNLLKGEDNNYYSEGGMILIKLKNDSILSNNYCQFSIKCLGMLDDKEHNTTISYNLKKSDDIYYSDNNIREALSLYFYAKFNRRYMKICNNENKNKRYNLDYLKSPEFNENKNTIMKFIESNYDVNTLKNKKENLLSKYIEKMNTMAQKAINYSQNKNYEKYFDDDDDDRYF